MKKIKQTLEKALIEAGRVIKQAAEKPISIEYKSPVSLLTQTDKKAERVVIDIIQKNFPDHAILSEESPPLGKSKSKWIIDPIDGTTNFVHGLPGYCVSIGYEEDGVVQVGGVFNPILDEWFWAERGKGASLNGKKIKVTKAKKLSESLLATGFPYDRRERAKYYLKFVEEFMLRTHGLRRLGSSAIDLCYVACGRFDGYWEANIEAWDKAAGGLLVTEAGGKTSDYSGAPLTLKGRQNLATNGLIHEAMLKELIQHKFTGITPVSK